MWFFELHLKSVTKVPQEGSITSLLFCFDLIKSPILVKDPIKD